MAEQHVRPARPCGHPRSRPRRRRLQPAAELPAELLALSASSPFVEGVDSGLHSARTEIFTRTFPRCGVPDVYDGWSGYERYVRFLYDTGSIDEHTQIWWSVRTHLAFPTVEIRICDAVPDLAEAQSLAALIYTLTVRLARAHDEGEPIELLPHRLIEENLWRAIRYGLSGELIDLTTGDVRPARAHLERLIQWVLPVADELGTAHAAHDPAGQCGRAPARAPRAGRDTAGDLRRAGGGGRGAGQWLRTR